MIRLGTAGWGIPSRYAAEFPSAGTHLERYAQVLTAAEIDTSFYRHHRRETYARWARTVPDGFRFAVKTPRALTQPGSLVLAPQVLAQFASGVSGLGASLVVLLVQLAPSVAFDRTEARQLFGMLRQAFSARLACEPRHPSWASDEAEQLLQVLDVARVAADPPRWPGADLPGGSRSCAYFRMHGAPRIYYSDYPAERLAQLANRLREAARHAAQVWCILDNTAHGHALGNALALQRQTP